MYVQFVASFFMALLVKALRTVIMPLDWTQYVFMILDPLFPFFRVYSFLFVYSVFDIVIYDILWLLRLLAFYCLYWFETFKIKDSDFRGTTVL